VGDDWLWSINLINIVRLGKNVGILIMGVGLWGWGELCHAY